MSEFKEKLEEFRESLSDSDELTRWSGLLLADKLEALKARVEEKLYQAFKAGCLSANDGIFPSEFEEEIKALFDEWRNKKAP